MTITAEPRVFDGDDVLAALEAVVKGNEGHIDPNSLPLGIVCKYVNSETGDPECIVGRALSYLHVSTRVLQELDLMSDPMFRADSVEHLAKYGIEFTPEAVDILGDAQDQQDGGADWGTALDVARRTHHAYTS